MFKEAINASNVIEFVGEQPAENNALRVIIRVVNETAWPKMIVKLLKQAVEDEDYYLQVMKEYYLDESFQPKFAWVLEMQGDLELAGQNLAPILAKRLNSLPTPPAYAAPAPQRVQATAQQSQQRTMKRNAEGAEITTVNLPFSRGNRDRNPEEVVRVMDARRGIRAAVRGVTG